MRQKSGVSSQAMTIAVDRPRLPSTYGPATRPSSCIGRFGLAKTTIDDIAREAGLLPGHALPLLRRQAGDRAPARSPPSSTASPQSLVDAGRAAPTFADAVVARRSSRRRASCAGTTRCSSCSRTNRKRCSATSRSAPATACSSRSATRIAPAFDRWLAPDDAHACGRLARARRCARTCSCRTRRSTSPTPPPHARSSTSSSSGITRSRTESRKR